jgi:hypothetical protein
MPRLSLWHGGRKSADYRFMDRSISEYFGIGGTAVLVHLYLGPYLGDTTSVTIDGVTVPAFDPNNPSVNAGGITTIQDPVLGENRDLKYSKTTIELRGIYNINDLDFDLRQFGLFLTNDTLYIEFHLNDMIARCGRKIIPGDVLELPHRRDTGLDPANQIAINKFYVVQDAARASDGYAPTWWPHVWRVKVSPMPAGQEYNDILNLPLTDPLGLPIGGIGATTPTLGSIGTTENVDLALNNATDAQAKIDVPARYLQTAQYWMKTPETPGDYPWVFAGDGIPPDGVVPVGSGTRFPSIANVGDYYLRTDYDPTTLFMWTGDTWSIQEQNFRPNWTAATDILAGFINNSNVTTNDDGTTAPEKVNLSRAVIPKADF